MITHCFYRHLKKKWVINLNRIHQAKLYGIWLLRAFQYWLHLLPLVSLCLLSLFMQSIMSVRVVEESMPSKGKTGSSFSLFPGWTLSVWVFSISGWFCNHDQKSKSEQVCTGSFSRFLPLKSLQYCICVSILIFRTTQVYQFYPILKNKIMHIL